MLFPITEIQLWTPVLNLLYIQQHELRKQSFLNICFPMQRNTRKNGDKNKQEPLLITTKVGLRFKTSNNMFKTTVDKKNTTYFQVTCVFHVEYDSSTFCWIKLTLIFFHSDSKFALQPTDCNRGLLCNWNVNNRWIHARENAYMIQLGFSKPTNVTDGRTILTSPIKGDLKHHF